VKKKIKSMVSMALIAALLALSLVVPAGMAPVVTPAEASTAPTINDQPVQTSRIGAVRGRGGVELARAASLGTVLRHSTIKAVVDLTPGSMLIRHGDRELLLLAGTRTAFLTTGVDTRAPSTRSVTLAALPRTVAARDLFVPFSDVVRHLGGSFTTARAATLREAAPAAPFNFAADTTGGPNDTRRSVVAGVDGLSMVGRGATFVDTLYGRDVVPGGTIPTGTAPWLPIYFGASRDLSGTVVAATYRVGYNRINNDGAIPSTSLSVVPAVYGNTATRGSGVGVDAVRMRLAHFGGTDMISRVPADVLADFPAIPVCKGGVAVVYNVVGTDGRRIGHLNLTADTIARIYLGQISRWNDAALTRLNPDAKLPNAPIRVNWRPDVSGTTEIFTTYLNAASPSWRSVVAQAYRITPSMPEVIQAGTGGWTTTVLGDVYRAQPAGAGTGGSELRNRVRDNANSIGYISYGDLSGRDFVAGGAAPMTGSVARVQNRAGLFVLPLLANVYAAGIGHGNVLAHPVNSANAGAYPIVGLTWIMVEKDPALAKPVGDSVQVAGPDTLIGAQIALTGDPLRDALRRNAVAADFIRWAVVQGFGDAEARRLDMAPLTPAMKRQVDTLLGTIRTQTH
jgi:phosphate transport system substrate-binding protein